MVSVGLFRLELRSVNVGWRWWLLFVMMDVLSLWVVGDGLLRLESRLILRFLLVSTRTCLPQCGKANLIKHADPCIYKKTYTYVEKGVTKYKYSLVALYVDDLIIACSNQDLCNELEKSFAGKFKNENIG